MPLCDTDGSLLKHLELLDDRVMPAEPQALAVFDIFAARAAELRRLRRDAALRESQAKLSRLFDSAMDGIVELDGDLRVSRWNADADVGEPFEPFVDPASFGKLHYLITRLREATERAAIAVPDGLRVRRADGSTFVAEASLSRYELEGRPYYAVIFRDVDERLQAESRIRALLTQAESLRAELETLAGQRRHRRPEPRPARRPAGGGPGGRHRGHRAHHRRAGTGKELIARQLHRRSARAEHPLIKVNCAAVPANLQESEFFGHEKGAFTGPTQRRERRFKLADGGTLFLDEVGELALDLQAKLLRVLQEGEFEPVGGNRTERVDVRLVAARTATWRPWSAPAPSGRTWSTG